MRAVKFGRYSIVTNAHVSTIQCIIERWGSLTIGIVKPDKASIQRGALELGESIKEATRREILGETGLIVEPKKLIGIYSKYFDKYPSGDEAQTIVYFFELEVTGGELSTADEETIELKFFDPNDTPKLVNKQHEDALADYLSGANSVIR